MQVHQVNTVLAKNNQVRVANLFLSDYLGTADAPLREAAGDDFMLVPPDVICACLIWEFLAQYLATVYIICKGRKNAGKHLHDSTAVQLWSGLIQQQHTRFSGGGASAEQMVSPAPLPLPPLVIATCLRAALPSPSPV